MSKFLSRKLLVSVGTIIINVLIARGLVPADIQKELMTIITIVAGIFVAGQAADDAVHESKKPDRIREENVASESEGE
jgi:hypothetical protein